MHKNAMVVYGVYHCFVPIWVALGVLKSGKMLELGLVYYTGARCRYRAGWWNQGFRRERGENGLWKGEKRQCP